MGNPSVRFDEGRGSVGHWPWGLSIHPFPPTLLKKMLILVQLAALSRNDAVGIGF